MPIMRNPFRKQDENVRPTTLNGVEKTADGEATKPISIKEKEQPVEYKLSEINDSGVFVPPSPPERKSFWTTSSSRSTTSSNHRSVFNENEPFNISRESFDSYRRSFDISARSPILPATEAKPRASLDSRTFVPPPRTSNSFHRPISVPRTQQEEEGDGNLEDVALDDPVKPPQPQKKRGMFSRIIDSDHSSAEHQQQHRPGSAQDGTAAKSSWHHFGGRKRGQSGQGAELGSIVPPKREETPKPEHHQGQPQAQQAQQPVKTEQSTPPQPQPQPQSQPQSQPQPQPQPQPQAQPGAENAQAPEIAQKGEF